MARRCGRQGCREYATAAFNVDPRRQIVFVEHFAGDDALGLSILCRRHADALSVPRGWSVDDRREAKPRLFRVAARNVPATDETGDELRPKRVIKAGGAGPSLFDPTDGHERPVVLEAVGGRDAEETKAMPWTPKFDGVDSLNERARPAGRLLSRAIGADATADPGDDAAHGAPAAAAANDLVREPFSEADIA